jgi:AcrR family transcriptional regulator
MSNVTMEEKQETKMRIQKAARVVFSQKGIQKASVREIAKMAGVGASTLYGYYSSKSLLFIETILPTIESRDTLDFKLDNTEVAGLNLDDITKILAGAVFSLPSSILDLDQEIIKEFHVVLFSISTSNEIKNRMENFLENEMKGIITKFITRLLNEGIIKVKLDASDYARFILNMMRAIFLEYIIIGELTKEQCYVKLEGTIRMSLIGKI